MTTLNSAGANSEIFFNRVYPLGNEMDYMAEAVASRRLAGDGTFTAKCQGLLQNELGASKVLLTTSCTHALELAALLLDLQPGDEVILPSFTFVSTVNAFFLRGATPVFVDIRPDTLNLDERCLEAAITRRTRAIVPVHYAGIGCALDDIMDVAMRFELPVVEDNAHGLFGKYRGRWLGTFGALGALSFHETKNFTCGEGGALIINDEALISRAEILREKGTNRSQFFRGEVDKYTWVDVGSSYLPSDILAAFLFAQLEQRAFVQERRAAIWDRYYESLREWADESGVALPRVPTECEQAYHLFYLLLPSDDSRDHLLEELRAQGIRAVFHYLPLHLSPMGRELGGREGDCPISEDVSGRLVRLPFYTMLAEGDQDRVIDAVRGFRP